MKENGWRRVNAVAITLDIIAPVAAGLVGMLLLPIILVTGLQRALPSKVSSNTVCQSLLLVLPNLPVLSSTERYLRHLSCPSITVLYVYPGIFFAAGCARLYIATQRVVGSWAQQIRDSEFLVEMRLRNFDIPISSPIPKESLEVDGTSPVVAQLEALQAEVVTPTG